MRKTTFAGLTILEPGEGLDTDNGAFIDRDRETIDHFLRLGAKLHRHNGLAGLENPQQAASGLVIASGGTIASNLTISLGYTLEDASGGETMLSPLAVVSTASPMNIPAAAPSAAIDYTGGSLLVDTYYYATTWIDGDGGETPSGPAVSVERAPGFASGQVKLSNLSYGMAAAGAVGWRLFRAKGGGTYDLLTTGGLAQDTFTDDGLTGVDCDIHPPTDSQNTTNQVSTLEVKLPPADANMAKATNINLYASLTGDFSEGSSLAQFPIASAGKSTTFAALNLADVTPPDVNLSIGGASLIDPDTELLDWPWRRSVAASALLGSGLVGNVKLTRNDGQLWAVLAPKASAAGPGEWTRIASAAAAAASASAGLATIKVQSDLGPTVVGSANTMTFIGSGGIIANVTEEAPGRARITLTAASARLEVTASGSATAPASVQLVERLELVGSGGIDLRETQTGGGKAKLLMEGQAATLGQEGMGVIVHKANASATRPTAFRQYTWMGTVKPNNMREYDIWIEA
jgi:hypothetical protein